MGSKEWFDEMVRKGLIKAENKEKDFQLWLRGRRQLNFFSSDPLWYPLWFLITLVPNVIFTVLMSFNYLFGFFGLERWRRTQTVEGLRPNALPKRIAVTVMDIGSVVITPLLMFISDCCFLVIWMAGYEAINSYYITPLTPRKCECWLVNYSAKCVVLVSSYIHWLEKQIGSYEFFNELGELGLIKA